MTLTESRTQSRQAPDLYGTAWLNGEAYAIRTGDGDVVLLDFFSSTNVQSLADLRLVSSWQEMYADAGLVVIGVHSPEFEFSFDAGYIEDTMREYGGTYRVVLDNKGSIRTSYAVSSLPVKVLVDRNGIIRYVLHGRHDILEFERAMQFLLREGGYHGELPSLFDSVQEGLPSSDLTDVEIRCGYVRGSLGNVEGYAPEGQLVYEDADEHYPGRIYLRGPWWASRESVRSGRIVGAASPSFRVVMGSGDLYVIARSTDGTTSDIEVRLNGDEIPDIVMGKDLSKNERGRAVVRVTKPKVYHVLKGLLDRPNDVVFSVPDHGVELFQISMIVPRDARAIMKN